MIYCYLNSLLILILIINSSFIFFHNLKILNPNRLISNTKKSLSTNARTIIINQLLHIRFFYATVKKMASASTTSARSLFVDSKNRLADRVQVNVNNIASIVRQIQRSSKSHELIMHSATQFAYQERAIENTENNLKKFPIILTHLGYQQESIEGSLSSLHHLKNQVNELQQLL